MKKFYKTAKAGTAPGGFTVRLDEKTLKTPLGKPLLVVHEDLAHVIAQEWASQGEAILPDTMPFMQLTCTLIDKVQGETRPALTQELQNYAASDLLCYHATHPQDLVARHEALWLPVLNWLRATHDVDLKHVQGIQFCEQDAAALATMRKMLDDLNDTDFTVVQYVTGVTGSVVLALALALGRLSAEDVFQAACVDEIYQIEKWGEDEPARDRLNKINAELVVAEKFLSLQVAVQ